MNNNKFKQTEIGEVEAKVDNAVRKLYQKDLYLFQAGVHERTIVHKLAEYLQWEFKGVWNVDCEYNRDGLEIKSLEMIVSDEEEKKEHRIFPDIIVHVRGKTGIAFNKLVVEIKTSNSSSVGDIEKLRGFTSPEHGFNYRCGLFIRFNNNVQGTFPFEGLVLEKRWFQNGEEINYEN